MHHSKNTIDATPTLKVVMLRSVLYFAGVCFAFPLYLGIGEGFANLFITMQRVLYVTPALIPSPLALIFLILPFVVWRAHEQREGAKTFFYASLFVLIFYVIMMRTWLTFLLLGYFIIGFIVAAGVHYTLLKRESLDARIAVMLAYLIVGPIMYWLLVVSS